MSSNSLEKESRVELDNKQSQIIDELKPLRALKNHYTNSGNSKKLAHVLDYIRRLEKSLQLVETQKEIIDAGLLNMILEASAKIAELENRTIEMNARIERLEIETNGHPEH